MSRRIIPLTLEEGEAYFLYGLLSTLSNKKMDNVYKNLVEKLEEELYLYKVE